LLVVTGARCPLINKARGGCCCRATGDHRAPLPPRRAGCSPAVFAWTSVQREPPTPGGPGSGLRPGRRRRRFLGQPAAAPVLYNTYTPGDTCEAQRAAMEYKELTRKGRSGDRDWTRGKIFCHTRLKARSNHVPIVFTGVKTIGTWLVAFTGAAGAQSGRRPGRAPEGRGEGACTSCYAGRQSRRAAPPCPQALWAPPCTAAKRVVWPSARPRAVLVRP
jgi:hypothetical protein